MVSSEMTSELVKLFDILKSKTLDIHSYSGDDFDVVFDLISTDSFLAGIADRVIEGKSVTYDEIIILKQKNMDGTDWITTEGSYISLEHLPEVLTYAQLLDSMRKLILRVGKK